MGVIKLHINKQCVKVISMATNAVIEHQISPVLENDIVRDDTFEVRFQH